MGNLKNYRSIVLTGGGTAGHVMPNLALVDKLKKHFNKIYYLGTREGIEYQLVKNRADIEFIEIPAVKFRRTVSLSNFSIPFKLFNSIKKAKSILKKIQPSIIFSKGGYVAIPVAIAGKLLKIKVISHESDITMGLANKVIYPFCHKLLTSFETTSKNKKKAIFTGSPIRPEILSGKPETLRKTLKFPKEKQTLLFFGGSIGATFINQLVWDNIDLLCNKYNVLHIVGKGKFNKNIKNKYYHQVEFVSNIQDYFSLADICICRSGANTIFELLAIKKPAILIPLPKLESRGDQILNAEYFQKKRYATVLLQENATSENLFKTIDKTIKKQNTLIKAMEKSNAIDATDKIISIILESINKEQT